MAELTDSLRKRSADVLARRRSARGWLINWAPAMPLLILLSFCLVAPIVFMLARSLFTFDGPGLAAWSAVLGQPLNQRAIVTSLQLGLVCATISVLVGTPMAWLVSRMLAGRRSTWLGIFNVAAHFGGIGLAFAYVATLGSLGMITLLLRDLGLTFDPPDRGSFVALVITYEHANIPLFVLLTVPAMGMVREEWSEAAQASAATRFQFWRRIGLPLLAPFIAAGFMLSFTWTIGIFGIAFALAGQSAAMPIQLITLQIGHLLAEDAVRGPERAAVLASLLMVVALAALLTYRALLRRGMRWLAGGVGGTAGGGVLVNPPAASAAGRRWPAPRIGLGKLLLFGGFSLYLFVPILAVLLYSLAVRWTSGVLPDGFTFAHWAAAFGDERILNAFATSFSLGIWTTLLVLALTVPAVYWARVRNARIRPLLDISAAIPFALPFVVIGFALLHFTGTFAPMLQGSYALLVLAYVAVSFPFVYWAIDGAMAAADVRQLAQAAEACGASPLQAVRRVVLPNIRPGLATGAMLAFALAIGEFALVKVLANSIQTVPMWSASAMHATGGRLTPLAVVTIVVFVILFALSALIAYVNRGGVAPVAPAVDFERIG